FLDKTPDIPQKARIVAVSTGSSVGTWPSTSLRPANGVTILFVTGFGDTPDTVPQGLRVAQLMLVGEMFLYREASGSVPAIKVPFGYDALTDPYRSTGVA